MSNMESKPVSSSASTGNAGGEFEKHVDAAFLALLLVRGIPPILTDCTVVEVDFQTEHLDWNTDDVLVIGENGAGNRRKLIGQVKRTFTVSDKDSECIKTITDCWKDFRDGQNFSVTDDRFAIITLRGTNMLLIHFAGLLDCARTSRNAADFKHRLSKKGFVHAKVVRYYGAIQKIVEDYEGRTVTRGELWPFLKVLHVLSYDLNSLTRQTESLIKTLLAHTTHEQDALGAADTSWCELLREVGEGTQHSKSYCRDDLPESLRKRHSPVSDRHQRAIQLMKEHSELILDGIRTTLGPDLHLGRDRLVQSLLSQLESDQVVIVAGPAGSGKSGIAKDIMAQLARENFTFSFRAEEFKVAHFDETLQRSQSLVNATALGAILAGQNQKVLLVESVERLLEASTRDAFTDMLTLLKKDRSWRLILTCRDYSSDIVRSSMLEFAGIEHSILLVPPLDDDELNDVEKAFPKLSLPLSNKGLRTLLRNPYMLDKAIQMPWPEDRPLPENERAFRMKFWKEVIRVDDHTTDGMPRRREEAFVEIALLRARALSLYASCADLDSAAVQALRLDSLLSFSETSDILTAPGHDVLEDWAILRWIGEQYAIHEGSLSDLAQALGVYPAIRRTYRKWVSELLEQDVEAADRLFDGVVHDKALSAQFCDDTLVSLLQSQESTSFLQRHAAELFANERSLLRRVIHLLRVGCMTTPWWFGGVGTASLVHIPDGSAWACVLRLVASRLSEFNNSRLLLLGFIEDAARAVNWESPCPDGAESIVTIAYWLLPHFDNYQSEKQRKRTLEIIAKLPNCNAERFAALMAGDPTSEKRDRLSEDFRKIVLWGMQGMAACRDLPEVVINAMRDEIVLTEENLRNHQRFDSSNRMETTFGIKEKLDFDSFPASAYHSPFLDLLRSHPLQAISFIIELFSHSTNWYGNQRVPMQYVEPPSELTLTFTDGSTQKQWCNQRLWNLYRGTSVGPYVLQSTLMALEHWLFEFAEAVPDQLDELLCRIIRQSNSVALTAVVASLAAAFPHLAAETLLVFLRSPESIRLDRIRFANESQASLLSGIISSNATNEIYCMERKHANARSHRQHDLESAIANLQFGPNASQAQEIIDLHLQKIPDINERTDKDRIWLLALHRMDLRKYSIAENSQEEETNPNDPEQNDNGGRRQIPLKLDISEPDVQQMTDTHASQSKVMDARLGLFMWGTKVFYREEDSAYDPAQWRERLVDARNTVSTNEENDIFSGHGGTEYVASVCIRDFFDELSPDEATWCLEIVCNAVERDADNWNQHERIQRSRFAGDRPAAWVLPSLLGKAFDKSARQRVLVTLVLAITHAINEVRAYATSGVGHYLWEIDHELTIRCINALATEAMMVQDRWATESERSYDERTEYDQIESEVATQIRDQFFEEIAKDAYQNLDIAKWTGSEANSRILSILSRSPEEPLAIQAFERLSHVLVHLWDEDDSQGSQRREISHEVETSLTGLLEEFLLKINQHEAASILQPILDAIDQHPRGVSMILQGVINAEDRLQRTDQFWAVWQLFASRVCVTSWLSCIDNEYSRGAEMVAAVFLTQYWKDDARHWRSLEGHSHYVHELFASLPASSTIFDKYVSFLYYIGEQSLPISFVRVANQLKKGDTQNMLKKGNTVFMLETLLSRYVFGHPIELKRSRELRESVLYLLDILVENGSSASYRMRDDFVTPISSGILKASTLPTTQPSTSDIE